jgi:hypothetical protein
MRASSSERLADQTGVSAIWDGRAPGCAKGHEPSLWRCGGRIRRRNRAFFLAAAAVKIGSSLIGRKLMLRKYAIERGLIEKRPAVAGPAGFSPTNADFL